MIFNVPGSSNIATCRLVMWTVDSGSLAGRLGCFSWLLLEPLAAHRDRVFERLPARCVERQALLHEGLCQAQLLAGLVVAAEIRKDQARSPGMRRVHGFQLAGRRQERGGLGGAIQLPEGKSLLGQVPPPAAVKAFRVQVLDVR